MALRGSNLAIAQGHAPAGRLIAVASGKGGVGKTTVAINLAHAFARHGERVLIFDGDLGLANIDVQLGLHPVGDLSGVVAGDIEIDDAVSPVLGGSDDGGFDVIAGSSGTGALSGLADEHIAKLAAGLSALALSYDRVIMDLAAGVEPATIRLAMSADDVLVVVQDEPTSITDAYAFIKCLRRRDDGAFPGIVVNASDGKTSANRCAQTLIKTCTAFLGFTPQLAGVIRRDLKLRDAVRRQTPLAERYPQSGALEDFTALVEKLDLG
ncbi:MAG: AAA family ATPase [Maricaulaceae bacterium]|jgi:flagellar biosynthesis protein FlhG